MQSRILFVAVVILAIIAYGDVRFRRVPNELSLAVALLGLGGLLLTDISVAARYTFMGGLLTFAVTFLLLSDEIIGDGDAKLIPAMALLIGHQRLPNFLLLMRIIYGLLALVVLAWQGLDRRRIVLGDWPPGRRT